MDIYTDGSCVGEPGPGGWAAVLVEDDAEVDVLYGTHSNTYAIFMELTAIREGLKAAVRRTDLTAELTDIVVYTDSQSAIDWCGRNLMTKNWGINQMILEIRGINWCFKSIKYEKVRAHSGNGWNELADRIARGAVNA